MRILAVFGQHNYGSPERGEGYEYSNFLPAFRRLGHEVIFFESRNRDAHTDFRDLNHQLLETVEKKRPDVLFAVVSTFEIWLETWQILRDSGITAIVSWATDDNWKYVQSSKFFTPYLHACATTYPKIYERYKKDGIDHVLLTQWAANAEHLNSPITAAECKYKVSFVGSAHEPRKKWVQQLKERGIEVECFGYGWPSGPVEADDIPKIIRQSVISLNFSNSGMVWDGLKPRRENQIKARTFEVPGAGGFLLTEWAEDMDRYYVPGKEIATFQNIDELTSSIHHYLSHTGERDQIANAGFARTKLEHTYDQRLAEVLDFTVINKETYESQPNLTINPNIDWEKFTEAEKRHEPTRFMLWLRKILVGITSLIWGPVRGPRAARVLAFQISYRLSGSHTYSSAGWPGRVFFKES